MYRMWSIQVINIKGYKMSRNTEKVFHPKAILLLVYMTRTVNNSSVNGIQCVGPGLFVVVSI